MFVQIRTAVRDLMKALPASLTVVLVLAALHAVSYAASCPLRSTITEIGCHSEELPVLSSTSLAA